MGGGTWRPAAGHTAQACNAGAGYKAGGVLCGECSEGYASHRNGCVACASGRQP